MVGYTDILVVTPKRARPKVEEIVAVDPTAADFGDDNVFANGCAWYAIPCIGASGYGIVRDDLVLNDVVTNIREEKGSEAGCLE